MKLRRWLAVSLAVLLVLAGQLLAAADGALDLDIECALTVNPCDPKNEMYEDLKTVDIVVDLYKVADWKAEQTKYSFTAIDPFDLTIPDDLTKGDWVKIAQQAAEVVLLPEVQKPKFADVSGKMTLESGLYLVVAHKRGDSGYVKTITDEDGNSRIVTQVKTSECLYDFAPELVALPSKQETVDGVINTANPGDWVYDLEVNLKPEKSDLKGSLEIVKTLRTYEDSAPATFVFRLDWDDGGKHYSDVRTLVFEDPGVKSLIVDDLPVGAEVTVTEVYSGAVYTIVGSAEAKAVIEADEIVSVEFVNDYKENPPPNGGGSITNKFAYSNNDWHWEKRVDSTEEYSTIE